VAPERKIHLPGTEKSSTLKSAKKSNSRIWTATTWTVFDGMSQKAKKQIRKKANKHINKYK